MSKRYFIKADVFGKTKYWEHINGLHSGKTKTCGYDVFDSIDSANKTVRKLRSVFHKGIKFFVLPDSEIPFIKKQLKNRVKSKP